MHMRDGLSFFTEASQAPIRAGSDPERHTSLRWKDLSLVKESKPNWLRAWPRPVSFTPVQTSAGST